MKGFLPSQQTKVDICLIRSYGKKVFGGKRLYRQDFLGIWSAVCKLDRTSWGFSLRQEKKLERNAYLCSSKK